MALETEKPNEKQNLTDNVKLVTKSAENENLKKKGMFETMIIYV